MRLLPPLCGAVDARSVSEHVRGNRRQDPSGIAAAREPLLSKELKIFLVVTAVFSLGALASSAMEQGRRAVRIDSRGALVASETSAYPLLTPQPLHGIILQSR